ncbi:MAG: acyl-CoA dehydrogenase C-terminal domain-containing protein, partial [Desulfosarcinaceae bacterium]
YGSTEGLADLAGDLQRRVTLLGQTVGFFADCFKSGKALVPISNALPFIHLLGDICLGWALFWQAGVAARSLADICRAQGVDPKDEAGRSALLSQNKQAAFYDGKIHTARYFIKHVLPKTDGVAAAIKSADLSMLAIDEAGF